MIFSIDRVRHCFYLIIWKLELYKKSIFLLNWTLWHFVVVVVVAAVVVVQDLDVSSGSSGSEVQPRVWRCPTFRRESGSRRLRRFKDERHCCFGLSRDLHPVFGPLQRGPGLVRGRPDLAWKSGVNFIKQSLIDYSISKNLKQYPLKKLFLNGLAFLNELRS